MPWFADGRRHIRPPILEPGSDHPGDVVARYQDATKAGDVEATVGTFARDGYYRGPLGRSTTRRGTCELRAFFTDCFGAGTGIALQHCTVTDDGVRCALEYNCVSWGGADVVPQAGICVHERGAEGLLTAVRVYDDVEGPPVVNRGRTTRGAARHGS